EVFVAPAGRPLADIASLERKLSWREARPILEQLAEELAAAQSDGTLPPTLSLDQVWVQPDGRVQLLDFPLPGAKPPRFAAGPLGLLREAATVTLEGHPRLLAADEFVRAPVPRHAARLLRRLLGGPKAYLEAASFREGLLATA